MPLSVLTHHQVGEGKLLLVLAHHVLSSSPLPPSTPLQLTTRHLQQQQMAGLSSVYHSLDGDRSGALSPKELKRALTEVGAHMSDEDVRRIFEFVSPSLSSSPLLSFPLS